MNSFCITSNNVIKKMGDEKINRWINGWKKKTIILIILIFGKLETIDEEEISDFWKVYTIVRQCYCIV